VPESIELTDVFLRVIGAFYAFAGFVATRAGMMSWFLDRALAAMTAKKPTRTEVAQAAWLLSAAAMILVGGVLLLAGLQLGAFVFIASAIGQALYVYVIAPRYFDVEDPPSPQGRRQTTNAFVLFCAATAFVAWAAWRGRLTPINEATWFEIGAVTAALGFYATYVARTLWWTPKQAESASADWSFGTDTETPSRPLNTSKRIKLMADYGCDPIWAMDDDIYGCFPPEDLNLSPELTADISAWAAAFEGRLDMNDPGANDRSEAEYAAEGSEHEAEGRRLAILIKRERPDLTVFAYTYAIGVVEVHADDAI
jgi:hypothetical protein